LISYRIVDFIEIVKKVIAGNLEENLMAAGWLLSWLFYFILTTACGAHTICG
jgi:hypothetical protein